MNQVINADPHGKIALQAHDPVAFHTVGKALKGAPSIMAEFDGYNYCFTSEENKVAFLEHPEQYLPAYGGYCAFGIAIGVFFPVDYDTFEIVKGRLVLQYNQDVKQMFAEDKDENLRKADENWLKIEEATN